MASRTPTAWPYLVAILSVAAGLAARFALAGVLGFTVPYITFFPAVMFAAWFGGLWPGLLATVLSWAAAYYFLVVPSESAGPGSEVVGALLFLGVAGFISGLNEALRRSRARSESRLSDLTAEIALRSRTERALAESREEAERARDLLQITLASIGDAVIATDANRKVTFLNTIAEQLTGWSQAEALGASIADVFPIRNERTGASVANPIDRALTEGIVVGLANHTILVSKNGAEIPIEDSAAPIRDGNSNVLGAVLVFRDVTARRKSEDAIAQSQERLQLALDAGQIGVWDWNVPENRIEWSDWVYQIHGVERGKFPGGVEDFASLIHPDDRQRVHQAITDALGKGEPYDIEFRVTHPDSSVHWVSTTAIVFRDEQGAPTRMLGATTDVTARHQAEADLRQQWQAFDTALSNTPDFTYTFDLEGRFTYVNRALLSLWQLPLDQARGKNFFELQYPPDLAARLQQQIQQVINTREPVRDNTPFTGPTGETRHYEYIFVPVFNADGRVEAVAGSTRDVTDQKESEAALRKANRELEEFSYVASHDLQEPLRMVNVYTQLILRHINNGSAGTRPDEAVQKDEALQQYAGFVQNGVQRMETLINDLLRFSRIVHSDDDEADSADLSSALADALAVLKSRLEETAAVISAPPLPIVRGDTMQLAHVFQNLFSNALKYARPHSPPEITVSFEQDGDFATIAIRDNGIGFEQQYAERVFGLFKRLHKDEYPGTGLGLAICKRIVERYGGRMWAEGRPGEGATFYFSLPGATTSHNRSTRESHSVS